MLLDRVWFWMLAVGVLYGFGKGLLASTGVVAPPPVVAAVHQEEDAGHQQEDAGSPAGAPAGESPLVRQGKALTEAAIEAAKLSVEICLGLIGVMALWLGMLKIAEEAGMVDALAWALRPLTRWLFPGVPDGHPAQGAMLMNVSANMLGLDNAATPFGLRAMRELQELNPRKETATDAMAMFLAINTSSVTLVPISIIALRSAAGSASPASPIAGMFLATCVSTAVAVAATRWMAGWRRFAPAEAEAPTPTSLED